ncbi:conserved hypothetical protein [Microsporum canis CBS 113480]|uniref:DUF6594 domain-containing protein n=1 Tax=Arthroderma otae (strain ATCC MYA-4605 / CBS 113480) TaxID=554155 RepID=C5FS60_ARTOC|nr:conserved hypothetical protein [Microsporum canis CBS 113480]EEQ32713.1 conserved hypothetical protein [Microsporum canis CBS 113480]
MAPTKTKKSKKSAAPPPPPPPPPVSIPVTGSSLDYSLPPLDVPYAIPEAELPPDHGFNEPLEVPYENEKEISSAARRRAASRASEPLIVPTSAAAAAATASMSTGAVDPTAAVFSYLDQQQEDQMRPSHSRKASEPAVSKASRPKDHARKASLSQLLRTVSGGSSSTAKERDRDRDLSPSRSSSVSKESEYQPATPPDMLFDPINFHIPGSKGVPKSHMAGSYMTDSESILEGPPSAAPAFMNFSHPEAFYMPKSTLSYSMGPLPSKQPERAPVEGSRRRSQTSASAPASAFASAFASAAPAPAPAPAPTATATATTPDQFEWTAPPETPYHVYRKFEKLNHRVLRHLQEEIAQLEDDLLTIDDIDAARAGASSNRTSPRQKQLAAKYRDQIQDHSNLPAASEDDIDAYRSFLRSPAGASSKSERRLLDHRTDLVTMAPRPASALHSNPLYSTVAAVFAAILFPLLAFGAISEFFGRIVVVSFVAGTFAWWASNGPPGHDYLVEPQDGWKCAVIYFGFMTLAALLL